MSSNDQKEVHIQCEECYDFFEELEPHSIIEHREDGRFMKEYYLCEDCARKHLHADYYDVFDVDNNRLDCPECGSNSATKLLPYSDGSEFAGVNFVCHSCDTHTSIDYEVSSE